MEDDNRREENNKITGDIENDGTAGPQEKGSGNQYQLIPKSPSNCKSTRNEWVTTTVICVIKLDYVTDKYVQMPF